MKNLMLLKRTIGVAGGLALNQLHANYMDANDSQNDNTSSSNSSSGGSSSSSIKSTAAKDRNLSKK